MNKLRKGDQVIVLTGRDKGKRGTVSQRVDDAHLVVDGVNVVKKHVKPNPMKGTTGGVMRAKPSSDGVKSPTRRSDICGELRKWRIKIEPINGSDGTPLALATTT